jgi:hypothetical protein
MINRVSSHTSSNNRFRGRKKPQVTVTPTPTVTLTPTPTVTPTPTSTPTNTPTVTPTSTPTETPTATPTITPTPTPTSGETSTGFLTFSEVGSNVVMTASGTIDLDGLTLVDSNIGPFMGGGIGPTSATFLMGANGGYGKSYSGFTTTPSNFGTGSGFPPTSTSGDIFGIIYQGQPPHLLVVPTGYTSGGQISSTQTFTGQTFSSLGLTAGTYTYTWGSGKSFNVVVSGTPASTPTPTPTPTSGTTGDGWLFYSPDNSPVLAPPSNNGNTTFIYGSTGTYNPNYTGGTLNLYFNTGTTIGTSYLSQFSTLNDSGGTITINQGSSTAIYSGTSLNYQINSGFLVLSVSNSAQMIQSASTPFVSGTTINVGVS